MNALSLSAIQDKDPESLRKFQDRMAEDGWAFVTLEEDIAAKIKEAAVHLENFFRNTSEDEKLQYWDNLLGSKELDGPVYGYNIAEPRKEGLRLLTGSRLKNEWIPPTCTGLPELSTLLDEHLVDLCAAVCPPLFHQSAEYIGKEYSVPLLLSEHHPEAKRIGRFAMMDVAYYFNTETENLVNCAEHTDPGLFSLSVLSTQPGLQLKLRSSGEWIDAPINLDGLTAVVWGGKLIEEISHNRFKAGIHRVTDPKVGSHPRMSIWTECVTSMQDLTTTAPLFSKINQPYVPFKEKKSKGSLMGQVKMKKKIIPGIMKEPIIPGIMKEPMSQIEVLPGESVADAVMRCSNEFGVPMTKLITSFCPICLDTIPTGWGDGGSNLEKHVEESHPGCIKINKN